MIDGVGSKVIVFDANRRIMGLVGIRDPNRLSTSNRGRSTKEDDPGGFHILVVVIARVQCLRVFSVLKWIKILVQRMPRHGYETTF